MRRRLVPLRALDPTWEPEEEIPGQFIEEPEKDYDRPIVKEYLKINKFKKKDYEANSNEEQLNQDQLEENFEDFF